MDTKSAATIALSPSAPECPEETQTAPSTCDLIQDPVPEESLEEPGYGHGV